MCLHNLLNIVLLNSITGKLQVQLALAYVTCCPGGISEAELEDTLSIDDVFLNTVFQVRMLIILLKWLSRQQLAQTKELDINTSFAYRVLNVIGQLPTL